LLCCEKCISLCSFKEEESLGEIKKIQYDCDKNFSNEKTSQIFQRCLYKDEHKDRNTF
jgi:hypothetical protein